MTDAAKIVAPEAAAAPGAVELFRNFQEFEKCKGIAQSCLDAIRQDLAPDEPMFVAPYLQRKETQ